RGRGLPRRRSFVLAGGFRRKAKSHPGSALARDFLRSVSELNAAAMLFQDAADNREPEAGPLFAGRDIRLKQATAVLFRQPYSVVQYVDHDIVALPAGRYTDTPAAKLVGRNGSNRLGRVFDDVRQGLRDQASIETCGHGILRDFHVDIDIR